MTYVPSQLQRYGVGDATSAAFDYQAAARAIATTAVAGGAKFVLVTMGLGGANARVAATYGDANAATAGFDAAAASNTSANAYVGLWDASSLDTEMYTRYFGVQETYTNVWTKLKSLSAPLIGAGVLIAAAVLLTGKSAPAKKSKSTKRRRRASSWRRRTTTVWR